MILYNHPKVVGVQEKVQRVSEEPLSTGSVWCDTCEAPERILAVKKSYRNVGKREKQEELFPALQKEIATRRLELHQGVKWPDSKARWSEEYKRAMYDATKGMIGGDEKQAETFFSKVIATHPE